MKLISAPGYAPFSQSAVIATAMILWALGRRRDALFALGTLGANFITSVIKLLVGRARPDRRFRIHQRTLRDKSFPSGHAAAYAAFYGYVFFLAYRYLPSGPFRTAAMVGCLTLIGGVGPSRVHLGHHWASDAIAGYLVGFSYLTAMLLAYEVLEPSVPAVRPWAPPCGRCAARRRAAAGRAP